MVNGLAQLYYCILKEIAENGFLNADHVFADPTPVKASANKRIFEKKIVRIGLEHMQPTFKKIELRLS